MIKLKARCVAQYMMTQFDLYFPEEKMSMNEDELVEFISHVPDYMYDLYSYADDDRDIPFYWLIPLLLKKTNVYENMKKIIDAAAEELK